MDDINDRLRGAGGDRANPAEDRDQVAGRGRGATGPRQIMVNAPTGEAHNDLDANVSDEAFRQVRRQVPDPVAFVLIEDQLLRRVLRDAVGRGDRER